jgi:ribosomal protein S18 acetylase RimI-like enzyme
MGGMMAELAASATGAGHIRRLNARYDLEAIADLVELCFFDTLDMDGRNYLKSMREAARSMRLMGWANTLYDQSPTPLTGLVWEQQGHIIGNLSLIPITVKKQHCYMIANVAVHPDYRGHGIGRTLTTAGLEFARQRHVPTVWLQVRDNNPPAIHLYESLKFEERTRRTTWLLAGEAKAGSPAAGIVIAPRRSEYWAQQSKWLRRLYPDELSWHLPLDWNSLRPDLLGFLYRFFTFDHPHHWAVQRAGRLQGVLTWLHTNASTDTLLLALPPDLDEQALLALLVHARQHIPRPQPLSLNIPLDLASGPLRLAGFRPDQTLIWMEYKL